MDGISGKRGNLQGISLADCRMVWVDVENPGADELRLLQEFFSLHPLAVEAAGEKQSLPRMQEFPDQILVAWEFPRDDPHTEVIEACPVYLILGGNFLVTMHPAKVPEIDSLYDKLGVDTDTSHHQPAFLLYTVMDESVEEFFPLVETLKEDIDAYMDELLADGGRDLGRVMHYKHRNMAVRRTVSSLRDVVIRLTRRDLPLIPAELSVYLMEIFDLLTRIYLETDNNSDLISSLLDIHLNMISNRLNVTMKRLTAIATFFMPATFLAGIYGMNFQHMPELGWYYGYLFFWVVIIVVTLAMFLYGRRQDWL